MVAGETSGDLLAAGLIEAIRERRPDATFEGIAGRRMQAAGCRAIYPADKLAVMGLVEVMGHLPELLLVRRRIRRYFLRQPPDVFIGIDAPDFNLGLERRLRAAGIPTVHYVSPTVWAWRANRVPRIRASVDHLLTLFPFEADFHDRHGIPATFVGHPLADLIPLETDPAAARSQLALPADGRLVALLPGSRRGEVQRLAGPFLEAAVRLHRVHRDLHFVAPMADPDLRALFEEVRRRVAPSLPLTVLDGHSREAMSASDAVLLASGTATLEALLLHRPMVVAYKMAPVTAWLLLRMLKVSSVALPNLLAGEPLVTELVQGDATAERLADAVLALLDEPERGALLQERFRAIQHSLRRQASARAAEAVLELVAARRRAA